MDSPTTLLWSSDSYIFPSVQSGAPQHGHPRSTHRHQIQHPGQHDICNNPNALQSTPGLTSYSINTPTEDPRDDSFLVSTPAHIGEELPSRLFFLPPKSFEIQRAQMSPEWEDHKIEEMPAAAPDSKLVGVFNVQVEKDNLSRGDAGHPKLQLLHLLSVGRICKVYLGTARRGSTLCAVKVFDKASLLSNGSISHAVQEHKLLKLLTALHIRFVPQLHWSFQDPKTLYIATNLCAGGNLQSHLARDGPLAPARAKFYATEIIEGIAALHAAGIVHRNICPQNVLIAEEGNLVLTGLGHAVQFDPTGSPFCHRVPSATGFCSEYQAPEMVLGWAHDTAVDVWGFGILLYTLLTGRHPFIELSDHVHPAVVESKILHADLPVQTASMDDSMQDLIVKCLQCNPLLRLKVREVKMHQYFSDIEWNCVKGRQAAPYVPECSEYGIDHRYFDFDALQADFGQVTSLANLPPLQGFPLRTESYQKYCKSSVHERTPRFDFIAVSGNDSGSLASVPSSISCTSFGELKPVRHMSSSSSVRSNSKVETLAPNPDLVDRVHLRSSGQGLDDKVSSMAERHYPGEPDQRRGLRKYASLDFDLNTIISLPRPSLEPLDLDSCFMTPPQARTQPIPQTTVMQHEFRPRWAPALWRERLATPPALNRLRKKKTPSRTFQQAESQTQIADLPKGIEQIGNGIGYTRPLLLPPREVHGNADSERRPLSFTPASCHALFVDNVLPALRAPRRLIKKTSGTKDSEARKEDTRDSEDELDSVMREMYGSTWDPELGVQLGLGFGFVNRLSGAGHLEDAIGTEHPGGVHLASASPIEAVPYSARPDETFMQLSQNESTLRLVSPQPQPQGS